jgi:hypothetical protein
VKIIRCEFPLSAAAAAGRDATWRAGARLLLLQAGRPPSDNCWAAPGSRHNCTTGDQLCWAGVWTLTHPACHVTSAGRAAANGRGAGGGIGGRPHGPERAGPPARSQPARGYGGKSTPTCTGEDGHSMTFTDMFRNASKFIHFKIRTTR